MIFGKPLALIGLFILTLNAQVPTEQSSAEKMIKFAQDEILVHPDSADAYYRLGQAYLSHWYSVADKAAEAFEKATRLKPNFAEA